MNPPSTLPAVSACDARQCAPWVRDLRPSNQSGGADGRCLRAARTRRSGHRIVRSKTPPHSNGAQRRHRSDGRRSRQPRRSSWRCRDGRPSKASERFRSRLERGECVDWQSWRHVSQLQCHVRFRGCLSVSRRMCSMRSGGDRFFREKRESSHGGGSRLQSLPIEVGAQAAHGNPLCAQQSSRLPS